jgi:hypothetical protein
MKDQEIDKESASYQFLNYFRVQYFDSNLWSYDLALVDFQ